MPASPRQKEIPFARVNHNKYMVTDKIAYIGKTAAVVSNGGLMLQAVIHSEFNHSCA